MTNDEKFGNRVIDLEKQVNDLQENLAALGVANNTLAGRHHALVECMALMLARQADAKNAQTLYATVVYDSVNAALDGAGMPEAYMQAVREETDVFFSRLHEHLHSV